MICTTAFLADAAIVANGKLYAHGGGWDTIVTSTFPVTHPAMALALIFRVEYTEAPGALPFRIDLLDEDEREVGFRADGLMNVGHSPTTKVGAPIFLPQALPIQMLQLQKPGTFHFSVTAAGTQLASVPFSVLEAPRTPQPTA